MINIKINLLQMYIKKGSNPIKAQWKKILNLKENNFFWIYPQMLFLSKIRKTFSK